MKDDRLETQERAMQTERLDRDDTVLLFSKSRMERAVWCAMSVCWSTHRDEGIQYTEVKTLGQVTKIDPREREYVEGECHIKDVNKY